MTTTSQGSSQNNKYCQLKLFDLERFNLGTFESQKLKFGNSNKQNNFNQLPFTVLENRTLTSIFGFELGSDKYPLPRN